MKRFEVDTVNLSNETFTDSDKLRAAYALNMCMVSVSQIIDYDDLYVLEQEYEGILNNLNLEMMPKDDALLHILKQLLDTITFFRIQEGDKKMIDKEYQHKMKNAIWKAVPNFGLIVAGGKPVTMAISLASQVGIGYMNYRREKAENTLDYEKQQWQLQRSAIEQFNGLRRELFDTAWRLADKYHFPDEYRLTERQIKQYDEILMDTDEIRKYERLTSIKDKFMAYPPFWYHYGNTANRIARNSILPLSDETREEYRIAAKNHFEEYWQSNKFALLREDQLASACALEYIDLLDVKKDRKRIAELLDKAVKFSGSAKDILQLCVLAYLRVNERDKASDILRILVNEEYNIVVNAQLLSGLYVSKVLETQDIRARVDYNILATRVNADYLFRLPEIGERISNEEIRSEFGEKQEDLLRAKFNAVLNYFYDVYTIRFGKIIPVPNTEEVYTDYYFSTVGSKLRIKDMQELFSSNYKTKKRNEYLERLSQCGFIVEYFAVLNQFYGEILELNCIRDRQKLQELISQKIVTSATEINRIAQKIDEKKVDFNDMCNIITWCSVGYYEEFCAELDTQVDISILGMNEMTAYVTADSALRDFCIAHNIPEPEVLLAEGNEAKTDHEMIKTYFGFGLLGQEGEQLKKNQDGYKKIREIIKNRIQEMNSISEKASAYLCDTSEFDAYFGKSKLKLHKDILQKAIAVYDDKSLNNIDLIFTLDSIVPVIRKKVQSPIPYIAFAGTKIREEYLQKAKILNTAENATILATNLLMQPTFGLIGLAAGIGMKARNSADREGFESLVMKLQPMIDDICGVLMNDI